MKNITKRDQIINEIKAARAEGNCEVFSKVYVLFNGESCDLIDYFESFNLYVQSMFGEDHDLDGGYLYINWALTDLSECVEFK